MGSGVVGEVTADLGRICRDFLVAVPPIAAALAVLSDECRVRPAVCCDFFAAADELALPEPFLLLRRADSRLL